MLKQLRQQLAHILGLHKAASSRVARTPARFKPRMESLEDRSVPATFFVNTFADTVNANDGVLSLREAISQANARPGADTIQLRTGTYNVTRTGLADNTNFRGDYDVTDSLSIVGTGQGNTVIRAKNNERLFDVHKNINLRLQDLSLLNGGNSASNGGAIQALNAKDILLERVQVIGCVGINGGAINAESGNVTLRNSKLLVNSASGKGGAIRVGTGKVFLDQSTVSGNSAVLGGGISTNTGLVTVARSNVGNNTASKAGGGIHSESATVNLSNSFVQNNESKGDGGGLFVLGTVNADSSRILNNRSATSGGGIAAINVNLVRSNVNGNQTGGFGGGLSTQNATLDRSTVSNNVATGDGGGMYVLGGEARLTDSTVHGNRATTGSGGGIAATKATLLRSTVSANEAHLFGGGVSALTANLTNSTISGNIAHGNGGGLDVQQGGGLILNSTIAFNHSDGHGGGIENLGAAVKVKNSIIAKNSANQSGQDVIGFFDSLGHNLVQNPFSGNANTDFTDPINRDILFIDPLLAPLASNGGFTQTHRLLAGSVAIDHGDNSGAPATDQRGVARPRDGDFNGSLIVDIGAFEL